MDLQVLIQLEEVPTKVGNILLPDAVKDRKQYAGTKAKLLAVGENAFLEWGKATKPEPGQTVIIAQYAGVKQEGVDGKDYTICQDKDILGVLA